MPFQKEFSYNPNPNYVLEYNNDKFKFNTNKFTVYVNKKENFVVDLMNIFTDYPLTFTSEAEFNTWRASCNMKYWQNQLNFAVYCATYGCGVSLYDHIVSLTSPILVSSLFQFHFYYQVRKILAEMKCAIPTNQGFNSLNNFIDMTVYTKICNEFNIDPNTDFRLKIEPNSGAGYIYDDNNKKYSDNYVPNKKTDSDYKNNLWSLDEPSGYIGHPFFSSELRFGDKYETFEYSVWLKHCKISQDIDDGWTRFMLQKSQGFTTAGIARINDSIRTFIYCVLGAQVQARTAIIGQSGTSPDAQKQFAVNLHDAIYADLSIPDSIERYQNAINNSHSKLDFAIGSGLYMIPSDLVMKIGSLDNYNNNILIATDDMDFGVNNINNKQVDMGTGTNAGPTNFKNPTELLGISSTEPSSTEPKEPVQPQISTWQSKPAEPAKYVNYQDTKYVLPLLVGLGVGLVVYFMK
jgi:archaellin